MSGALPIDPVDPANSRPDQRTETPLLFPATLGRFDDIGIRQTIDQLVGWVETEYQEDLRRRPSKHVYISKLPDSVVEQIDTLRDSRVILDAIQRHFGSGSTVTPMKHTDELYISHYNKDHGGDQGLYSKHYDGNLRFLPFCPVVRALIYLQSDATYKVVFGDSRVEKAFVTYDFGVLDFHRELHWVEGTYNPDDRQRILLKCNYLVAPQQYGLRAHVTMAANTAVFYVVKAAMEYSKSPTTPATRFVGLLCNLFRMLNNIHPLVPIAFMLGALGAVYRVLSLIL